MLLRIYCVVQNAICSTKCPLQPEGLRTLCIPSRSSNSILHSLAIPFIELSNVIFIEISKKFDFTIEFFVFLPFERQFMAFLGS